MEAYFVTQIIAGFHVKIDGMEKSRIIFMGSPAFAVPVLKRLAARYSVVGVVTQPDRPAGRGKIATPPPIKLLAEQLEIPVFQPFKLREPGAFETLAAWMPDMIVVAAFGQILRKEVLELPRLGCINVHASLLPRWRGAAPIQASILAGDMETGISIMKMDPGIDTGPVLSQKSLTIANDDTAETLSERLSLLGVDLLMDTLPLYINGQITPVPQEDLTATYAPMLKKEDGILDFEKEGEWLERKIRAYNPWPGAFIEFENTPLKILKTKCVLSCSLSIGERGVMMGFPTIGTGKGCLLLEIVQPAGKKPMSGDSFLRGARKW